MKKIFLFFAFFLFFLIVTPTKNISTAATCDYPATCIDQAKADVVCYQTKSTTTCTGDTICCIPPPPTQANLGGFSASCKNGLMDVWTLDCIFPLASNIIFWLLVFAGIIALIIIIVSGLRLIMSGGDPKAIDQARKTLAWAIIGLVIVFLSFFIINIISVVTGVKCIDPSHPLSFTSCQ